MVVELSHVTTFLKNNLIALVWKLFYAYDLRIIIFLSCALVVWYCSAFLTHVHEWDFHKMMTSSSMPGFEGYVPSHALLQLHFLVLIYQYITCNYIVFSHITVQWCPNQLSPLWPVLENQRKFELEMARKEADFLVIQAGVLLLHFS